MSTQQLKRSEEEESLLRDIREEKERIWIDIQVRKISWTSLVGADVWRTFWSYMLCMLAQLSLSGPITQHSSSELVRFPVFSPTSASRIMFADKNH